MAATGGWPSPVGRTTGFTKLFRYIPCGSRRRYGLRWLFQRATKLVLWTYMRLVHQFEVRYHPGLPRGSAYVAVMSHTSWLDAAALMAGDPYDPPTGMIIKSEAIRIPVIGWILERWGAIAVDRRGRDVVALRKIRRAFEEGRGICIAPAGTRSADGRLGPFSPVLARLIVQSEVAVFPVAIIGSLECMPKGSRRLKPGKIWLDSGPEIDLSVFRGRRLSREDLETAARVIRGAIEKLLPDYMKSLPNAPVLGRLLEGQRLPDGEDADPSPLRSSG